MARTIDRFTSRDLALTPDEGKRYEVIDGELYVSRAAGFEHQYVCTRIASVVDAWSQENRLGVVLTSPRLVLAEDDDVIPDLIWIGHQKLSRALDEAGHLTIAPELTVEVLSVGKANQDRDREAKLKLYSRRGVQEYWIVDPTTKQIEAYRREKNRLRHGITFGSDDLLVSSVLPGFSYPVKKLFPSLPQPRHSR